MTTVVAGGDSFIWGSELKDSPHGGPFGWSNNTFTALLSQNYRYCCAAYPGYGNRDIAKNVILCCEEFNPNVVMVCWTWPGRDDRLDSDDVIQSLQDYLEFHEHRYMFTCADNCVITGQLNYNNWFMFPPAIEEWNTTEPRGFYQWAAETKYECGPDQHPLETAHRDAAKLIQGRFNELVKKSVQ